MRVLGWSPRDAAGITLVAFAAGAIVVNMVFMQSGSHPAPMFKTAVAAARSVAATGGTATALPRPRQAEPALATAPAKAAAPAPAKAVAPRTPGAIITDIQRELSRRGFFEGVVDGFYGPKTDRAIRDFEHAAGFKPSTRAERGAAAGDPARRPVTLAKGTTRSRPGRAPDVRSATTSRPSGRRRRSG